MSRFHTVDSPFAGAVVLERQPLGDARGFLERLYCDADLAPILGQRRVRQVNRTLTARQGTLRGLHFQRGVSAEAKIVTCLRGRVLDVAVDLRSGPTYLHHYAVEMSAVAGLTFVIPEGCAHGFQTLSDDCEMLYLHTAAYDPAAEEGIDPFDPMLAIDWPLPVAEMSERDRAHPRIETGKVPFEDDWR